MTDQQTIDELRKAARCAPIAMDAVVADDIARILNGAADALDEMLANGPAMQRGTNADGATLMGTMREVMEDYKVAAEAEAKAADEVRRENEKLLGAIMWALGVGGEFKPRGPSDGKYYWRKELSERAGLKWDRTKYVKALSADSPKDGRTAKMNDQTGFSYNDSLLAGVALEVDERFNYQFRFPDGALRSASMTEVLLWEVVMQLCCSESDIAITADESKE